MSLPLCTVYPNTEAFHAARGGQGSAVLDLGVWWVDNGRPFPRYRVSVVHDSGDVFAFCFNGGAVELLGTLGDKAYPCMKRHADFGRHGQGCAFSEADDVFEGWSDLGEAMTLSWVRERLAAHHDCRDPLCPRCGDVRDNSVDYLRVQR
jgi:hypothetical protein